MIRSRQTSGAPNPISSSIGFHKRSDENENEHEYEGTGSYSCYSSEGGGINGGNKSKEKHEIGYRCCNNFIQRQRKDAHRRITVVALLLFVLFCIYEQVLFSAVQQQPISISPDDPAFGESSRNQSNSTASTGSVVSDRYRARKTIRSLPTNSSDYSTIETMVKNFYGRDKAWYDACAVDNANSWRNSMRNSGGIGKFFDRACPNTGHPQGIHWNPFVTKYHNCSSTSRIHLEITKDNFWEGWQIKTMDASGVSKTIGGDTFYIVYSEYFYGSDGPILDGSQPPLPTAVAIPTDYYNGTYGLNFVSVPFMDYYSSNTPKHNGQRKKGRLTIHFITTCFIGTLYPPLKDGWKTGGQTNVAWTIENVDRPYKVQDWYTDRYYPLRHYPKTKVRNSLSDFDRVAFAGDSILTQMIWDQYRNDYHSIISDRIRSGTIRKFPIQVKDGTGPSFFHTPLSPVTLPDFLEALDPWIRGLKDDENSNNETMNYALVLGSAAWDVIWPAEWQGPEFQNHLSAVESLLRQLRTNHPEMTLVWKLPYAQHNHAADHKLCFAEGGCSQALKYASKERFENLYWIQKKFLERTFEGDDKVRLLDLYDVSYLAGSHWMSSGDSIHYQPAFNAAVLERLLYAE